jgi:hypothetical protein
MTDSLLVREIIAKRVIEAAKAGELDPLRLRNAGLAAATALRGHLDDACLGFLRNKNLRLSIDRQSRKIQMARRAGRQPARDLASNADGNRSWAKGSRARNEAPQKLPLELIALLERLKEQQ